MFALVVRFDLQPGTEDDFDRLVEDATAKVRSEEPGNSTRGAYPSWQDPERVELLDRLGDAVKEWPDE